MDDYFNLYLSCRRIPEPCGCANCGTTVENVAHRVLLRNGVNNVCYHCACDLTHAPLVRKNLDALNSGGVQSYA